MDIYKVALPGGRVLYMTEESRRNFASLASFIAANAQVLAKDELPPRDANCLLCAQNGFTVIVKKDDTETAALIRQYIENL